MVQQRKWTQALHKARAACKCVARSVHQSKLASAGRLMAQATDCVAALQTEPVGDAPQTPCGAKPALAAHDCQQATAPLGAASSLASLHGSLPLALAGVWLA